MSPKELFITKDQLESWYTPKRKSAIHYPVIEDEVLEFDFGSPYEILEGELHDYPDLEDVEASFE